VYELTVTAAMNLVAKFLKSDVDYTVKHHQQNLNDDQYTEVLADRQTLQ
jgi:hypothetical protein